MQECDWVVWCGKQLDISRLNEIKDYNFYIIVKKKFIIFSRDFLPIYEHGKTNVKANHNWKS